MQKEIFPVSGMMCASCAISVEKILKEAKGVKEVNVNYANQKANITFDEVITSAEILKKIVQDAGYDLEINLITEQSIREKEQKRYKTLQKKFFWKFVMFCSSFYYFNVSFAFSL